MKNKFDNIEALYTDTDSVAYYIKTEDFYKDISNDGEEYFDTSQCEMSRGGIVFGLNK